MKDFFDRILPGTLKFYSDHYICGDSYRCVWAIKEYPPSTEEQAIKQANSTEYGLASYIYSRDFNRLLRVAEQIEFGLVGFNAGVISNAAAPFGGMKQSGMGREGGAEGLDEYTSVQYIGIADPYAAK